MSGLASSRARSAPESPDARVRRLGCPPLLLLLPSFKMTSLPYAINAAEAEGRRMEDITQAEAFVRAVSPWLVHIVEACSVLAILYGVVRAVISSIASLLAAPANLPATRIRLGLGQSLSLALEFLLAADI